MEFCSQGNNLFECIGDRQWDENQQQSIDQFTNNCGTGSILAGYESDAKNLCPGVRSTGKCFLDDSAGQTGDGGRNHAMLFTPSNSSNCPLLTTVGIDAVAVSLMKVLGSAGVHLVALNVADIRMHFARCLCHCQWSRYSAVRAWYSFRSPGSASPAIRGSLCVGEALMNTALLGGFQAEWLSTSLLGNAEWQARADMSDWMMIAAIGCSRERDGFVIRFNCELSMEAVSVVNFL
jgi:hypothetical protein